MGRILPAGEAMNAGPAMQAFLSLIPVFAGSRRRADGFRLRARPIVRVSCGKIFGILEIER
jgi:hypothetical protein